MGSNALTSTLAQRTMPLQAILRHDLRTLRESWMVRIWLVGCALLTLLLIAIGWATSKNSLLIASLQFPYLVFPWFLVVMVLGVNPVSGSRIEALADGFLSRPITRTEYLFAVWASRLVVVLGGYLLVMVPAVLLVALANRPKVPADSVTVYGVVATLAVVGLVLALQVSLAFLMGILFRRPLVALVILLFFWYPVNGIMSNFHLEAFSPINLNQALPVLLKQPWRSADADAGKMADDSGIRKLREGIQFVTTLSFGGQLGPEEKPSFYGQLDTYRDFSLLRVLLGYGIPTAAALGLSLLIFSLRDL